MGSVYEALRDTGIHAGVVEGIEEELYGEYMEGDG